MYTFFKPTCVWEGGKPLRPYTPTSAAFSREMLNFKKSGWSIYSWDLQKTPGGEMKIFVLIIQYLTHEKLNAL